MKDGTKITGTIVGFEDNSFKVKTSYGFAVVQKDQVVSITVTDPARSGPSAAEAKKSPPSARPAGAESANKSASAPAPPTATGKPARPELAASDPAPRTTNAAAASRAIAPPSVAATPPTVKPVASEPMREEVSGNTYTNLTYGFRMYKPPDWQVIEGARATLPGTITAMGTEDQTTYLLIGQNIAGKSLASDIDATERRLREIMDNYRPLGDSRIAIAGAPAIERRFRGSVDNHDWSGVVVFVPRSTHLYTIFGMTIADTDLVQIQENVIARTISSLQFTK
ncbi:MAG: hypothetical protein ACRD4S_10110 [Candidatus Acidiferrales bacterium]